MRRSKLKSNVLSKDNATEVLLMLMSEGVPLKEAKKIVFRLWERGELNFLELEQERRKVVVRQ